MKTLIKNGQLVLSEGCFKGDLLIENDKIAQVAPQINDDDAQIYDAQGGYIFPGFIDAHTHLDMTNALATTSDDFLSGSKAAICGGTTTIIDFATQEHGQSLSQALDSRLIQSANYCYCDYALHMGITDWHSAIADELPQIVAKGITSYKVYMAYDNLRLNDYQIYQISRRLRLLGSLLMVHCENGDLINCLSEQLISEGQLAPDAHALSRPPYLEAEALSRILAISEAAGTMPYIVHLSSERALAVAKAALERGQRFWLETCPQYLFLNDYLLNSPPAEAIKYICAPPLRKEQDQNALKQALAQGIIDVIATDHCSYRQQGQKDKGLTDFRLIPGGLPGIEHRNLLMFSQADYLTMPRLAALLAENPARIFGLYPQKGILRAGSDADITIIAPCDPYPILAANQVQDTDYTPYQGLELKAKVQALWLRGKQIIDDGNFDENIIEGQYLHRGPSAGAL